jgi:hypothetical protein
MLAQEMLSTSVSSTRPRKRAGGREGKRLGLSARVLGMEAVLMSKKSRQVSWEALIRCGSCRAFSKDVVGRAEEGPSLVGSAETSPSASNDREARA